jgi:hypothetical protein
MPEEVLLYTRMEDRDLAVHLTERAMLELKKRKEPLHVRMELYFSCFIKKMLQFSDAPSKVDETKVSDKLFASFRPVQSKSCNMQDLTNDNSPTLIDLPVVKKKAIIPRHLFLDCKKGKWSGDFTWLHTITD